MMKRKILSTLTGFALTGTLVGSTVTIAEPAITTRVATAQANETTYLGVALSPIPDAVGANLLNVPAGQGIMITHVDPGSPADKAGLSDYDILLTYGSQKLYSPRQLTALVQADPVGKQVAIDYVHQGKLAHTQATLGGRQTPSAAMRYRHPYSWFQDEPFAMPSVPWGPFGPMPHGRLPSPRQGPGTGSMLPVPRSNVMEQFDSLSIQQNNGTYQIEIAYLDKQGVKHSFRYEGKADEVKKLIKKDESLPDDKRQQLLDALNMEDSARFPDVRSLMERMGMPWSGPWGPFSGPHGW